MINDLVSESINHIISHLILFHIVSVFQRTKPKGLIDLTYSAVYSVHQSLFGRYVYYSLFVKRILYLLMLPARSSFVVF